MHATDADRSCGIDVSACVVYVKVDEVLGPKDTNLACSYAHDRHVILLLECMKRLSPCSLSVGHQHARPRVPRAMLHRTQVCP